MKIRDMAVYVRDLCHQEIVLLLVLFLLAAGAFGFVRLADAVMDNDTQALDESVLRSVRSAADPAVPIGPPWVAKVARDVSALGSSSVLLMVTTAVAVFLLLTGKRHAMWLLLGATTGGITLIIVLKEFFGRARPVVVPHLETVSSASFPSGHSMLSAIVYLTLGALLARVIAPLRMRVYVLAAAATLAALVGVSRVFLGVHYPTDVLGGWAAGLAWALSCWVVARRLQRRGKVEE